MTALYKRCSSLSNHIIVGYDRHSHKLFSFETACQNDRTASEFLPPDPEIITDN